MNDALTSVVGQLRLRADEIAATTVERHWQRRPELVARYGHSGRQRCMEDAKYHLLYLLEAAESGSPVLFADYLLWARLVLEGRAVPSVDLVMNIECLDETLREQLSAASYADIAELLQAGLTQLQQGESEHPSFLEGKVAHELAPKYLAALLECDRNHALQLVMDAVAEGTSIPSLYLHVFQPVQYEIGRMWQLNRISVAQEHYCTAVTQLIMSRLYPQILSHAGSGRLLVCACVGGDLHEMGSRMVADLFELEGWDTVFLGASTPVAGIVQMVQERRADLLALSATMTYHLPQIRQTIAAVRQTSPALILVGGRPFNLDSELWRQVGADGGAPDAGSAVSEATKLLNQGGKK